MPPELAAEIVARARTLWPSAAPVEVTLEANPADRARFAAFAAAGVDRLSLGVQSLNAAALAFLGRDHDVLAARAAIAAATAAFRRVSLDLIYALPGQTAEAWRADLEAALAFGCEHLSAYQLTIEPETAFGRAERRGRTMAADPEAAADLYALTQAITADAGLDDYEISNHARGPAARSRHNLAYWRGEDYLGVGPGAHGRLTRRGARLASVGLRRVADYIAAVESGEGAAWEPLDARAAALERLLMGLRTSEGVGLESLSPLAIGEETRAELAPFVRARAGGLRLTRKGRPVLDAVLRRLVDGA